MSRLSILKAAVVVLLGVLISPMFTSRMLRSSIKAHQRPQASDWHGELDFLDIGEKSLVPKLVPTLPTAFKMREKITTADVLGGDSNQYQISLQNYGQVLRFQGNWASSVFGYRNMKVYDNSMNVIFEIQDTKASWNPFQMRYSFRVFAPYNKKRNSDVLYTIVKDVMGRGFLGKREEWRIYRGLSRKKQLAYYCVGDYLNFDFKCYHSKEDYDKRRDMMRPVATLSQKMDAAALFGGETGGVLADTFYVNVQPGEDAALLTAFSAVLDIVDDEDDKEEAKKREREASAEKNRD